MAELQSFHSFVKKTKQYPYEKSGSNALNDFTKGI